MSDSEAAAKESGGVPAWVMTFADLMTLLMCFFVLLLAFSEMDAAKFKQLSGSMKEAFGVQAEIEARTIPKGTSIIAQEFSPGTPNPTPMNVVRQHTIDSNQNTLDAVERQRKAEEEAEQQAERLRKALSDEITSGAVALELNGARVTIRVLERASFASASDEIRSDFLPTLRKIAGLIVSNDGSVTVSGHTDNLPIANDRYRSNWELSTARAVSVAHELLEAAPLDESRFLVIGHADTRPQAANDTEENRAKNRRVEISITRGGQVQIEETEELNRKIAAMTAGEEINE